MDDRLLTVTDVAKMLSVSEITVYRHVSERKIPFIRVGSCLRFSKHKLKDWLATKEQKPIGA